VWASPLDDALLERIASRAATLGFDAIELPVESLGGWDPARARDLLDGLGLKPFVVAAMGSGRDLVDETSGVIEYTQSYLQHCVDVAVVVGAGVVAGPIYARTGRTWRMTPADRMHTVHRLRESLRPLVDYAASREIVLAVEPLNRFETSLINTVEQGLDALDPLLGEHLGLALDSFHLNIEEKRVPDAVRSASGYIAHVQVCGNDRGAVGDDHIDWPAFLDALDDAGYTGPLNLESFTGDNETIATAASIWRPLAPSQDELATRSLRHLRELQAERTRQ
jgi:D-psicose/D-tagatose/L-ribulose 3-epimerase